MVLLKGTKNTPVTSPIEMPLRHFDISSPGISENYPVDVWLTTSHYQDPLGIGFGHNYSE